MSIYIFVIQKFSCNLFSLVTQLVSGSASTVMDASKQTLVVAGLNVDVYSHPSATDPSVSVHALFFFHGRGGFAQDRDIVTTVKAIFDVTYASNASRKKDLIIISFVSITPKRP